MTRHAVSLCLAACLLAPAAGLESGDVLFFAPFEGAPDAAESAGAKGATVTGPVSYGPGKRGQAVRVEDAGVLRYVFADNCRTDEGTVAMWVKPEWSSDDEFFHFLFRAVTGSHGGKLLNAIQLYKYLKKDHLMFYTSDGAQVEPWQNRTFARKESVGWKRGEWLQITATWSNTLANTEMVLYLNGQRAATAAGQVFVPDTAPEVFELGGPIGTGATWFDDVLVCHRPLMATEVAALYGCYKGHTETDPAELPFVSSREVQLQAYVNFTRGQLLVDADCRGARQDLAGRPARVALTASRGEQRWQATLDLPPAGLARFTFPHDRVGPGELALSAVLALADGTVLRRGDMRYTVPTRPVWLGNHLGLSDQVLPPWTPLAVDGDAVRSWGRTYRFADSPLPAAVTSQARELLRAPIALSGTVGGRAATLTCRPDGPFAGGPARVARQDRGKLGPLDVAVDTSLEFDGFLWTTIRLTPRTPTAIERLELNLPFRDDAATLYHSAEASWSELSDAGAVGEVGWSRELAFVPYYWVGTEQGGLAWVCETNEAWSNADPKRVIDLRRSDDGVDLTVRVIDRPTTIDRPLELSFGLIATPVKPMPDGWRDWRQMFISATNLDAFIKSPWARPGCRNIGVVWSNHIGSFSYLPTDPEALKAKVGLLRQHDWTTLLTYFALDYTQAGTPDFQVGERDWRRNPYAESPFTAEANYATVCNASTWADFLVWAINRTMDQAGTDGVYLDCSNPNFCRSDEHGCAPGRYPILATRALQKRIYALVKQKRGAAGFVYNHNSENQIITTFAYSDAVLNGEQYNKKDLRTLTPAKFRAELSPQPYGVPTFLLPTLVKFQPDKQEKLPGPEFLAYPFLHDVICVPSWLARDSQALLRDLQSVLQAFGAGSAEFLPYWSNAAEIAVAGDEATVSAYRRQDGAVLLMAQAAQAPAEVALTFRDRLAEITGGAAKEALTDRPLTWRDGALCWSLPDRSLKAAVLIPR